jgi:hypothetical protein
MEQNLSSINLLPVNSKTITAMALSEGTMYVQFASGVIYKYPDTTEAEYKSIIEDVSVGSKLRRVVAEKLHAKLSVESEDFKRIKY